jgi:hypothetical protein
MKMITLPSALGLLLAMYLHAAPAEAQSLQTWVSKTGTNTSDC